jgi:hypothetical protein
MFSYLDSSRAPIVPLTGGLTLDQRRAIVAVSITIRVNEGGDPLTKAVVIENTVRLPNLGITEG